MKTYNDLYEYIKELSEYSKALSDLTSEEFQEFITSFLNLEKGEKIFLLEMILDNISEKELKSKEYYDFLQHQDIMVILQEMLNELP